MFGRNLSQNTLSSLKVEHHFVLLIFEKPTFDIDLKKISLAGGVSRKLYILTKNTKFSIKIIYLLVKTAVPYLF